MYSRVAIKFIFGLRVHLEAIQVKFVYEGHRYVTGEQVAQLSQRDHAAAMVSCGANINVVLRIHRTLLQIAAAVSFTC